MNAGLARIIGVLGIAALSTGAWAQDTSNPEDVPPPVEQPTVEEASPTPKKKSGAKDIAANFKFIGGGVSGWTADFGGTLAGRAVMGWGGYWYILYGSFAAEGDFSKEIPWNVRGVGNVGFTIPIPIVHIQLGLRIGGGGIRYEKATHGEFIVGGQLAVLIAEYGGGYGVRIAGDLDFGWFAQEQAVPRLGITLALVL